MDYSLRAKCGVIKNFTCTLKCFCKANSLRSIALIEANNQVDCETVLKTPIWRPMDYLKFLKFVRIFLVNLKPSNIIEPKKKEKQLFAIAHVSFPWKN